MKNHLLVIALLVAAALPAASQQSSSGNPCASAGEKYCSASKNFREFIKCLSSNKGSLSAACASRVDFAVSMGKKFQEKKSACKADREKYCKDAGENTFKCLLRNRSKFTKACQKDLDDWKRAMSIVPDRLKEQAKKKISAPPGSGPKK